MKSMLFVFSLGLLLSCQNSSQNLDKSSLQELSSIQDKKAFYQTQMKEKKFSLNPNGSCDDALEDTLHLRAIGYIDSLEINKSKVSIAFKFKNACCQEFLGDYHISGDTLLFEYEQVNDEVCSCLCWYRYRLEINNLSQGFKGVKISPKP